MAKSTPIRRQRHDRHLAVLRDADLPLFRDHLLRLDAYSRRDRFNGVTDDEFVRAYAARCFERKATVIGFLVDGRVEGAAELHARAGGDVAEAEVAFSVESHRQNQGVGSLLFEKLIERARALGVDRLLVTTHAQNEAMKALARKFNARLDFQYFEAVGVIDLAETAAAAKTAAQKEMIRVREAETADPARAFAGLVRAIADFQLAAMRVPRSRDEGK